MVYNVVEVQEKDVKSVRECRALKYMQIYGELKRGIKDGVFSPGERLPSESALCREYDVQRDTVRHALELLVNDGLIVKQPGRGSFVCSEEDKILFAVDPEHLKNPILSELLKHLSGK